MTVDNITMLAGRCYQLEKKLVELEERLNEHANIRIPGAYKGIEELEEKLDEQDGRINALEGYRDTFTGVHTTFRERLDAVESRSAGTSNYTRSLNERLDALDEIAKTQARLCEANRKRLDEQGLQIEASCEDVLRACMERLDELSEDFYGGGLDKEFLERMDKLEPRVAAISNVLDDIYGSPRKTGRLRKLEDITSELDRIVAKLIEHLDLTPGWLSTQKE